MNKINPLYIALLVVLFLAFSVFKLSTAKEELKEEREEFAKIEDMALRLHSIQEQYTQETKLKAQLTKLLSTLQAKGVVIQREDTKSTTSLSSMEIGLQEFNILTGKIFNDSYQIKELKINKISDEKARFVMEIQW